MKKPLIYKEKDGVKYLIPFILVTVCFALWGFANDITNPMVKSFSKIFRMSTTDGALVQLAFLWWIFRHGSSCRFVYQKILIQERNYGRAAALCGWRSDVYPCRQMGKLLSFFDSIFHNDVRLVFSRDACKSIYSINGRPRIGDSKVEFFAVIQSDWILDWNVCGDEFHPGEDESFEYG